MNKNTINTIIKVSKAISQKYTFGYYSSEDIEQECYFIAVEALKKYDSSLGSLENFLYTCLHNGLKNFLRKNYYRKLSDVKCKYCGNTKKYCPYCARRKFRLETKKRLLEPLTIENVNYNKENNMVVEPNFLEQIELDEIFSIIDKHLEISLRVDYLKMLDGVNIPKSKREVVENRIMEILEQHYNDKIG